MKLLELFVRRFSIECKIRPTGHGRTNNFSKPNFKISQNEEVLLVMVYSFV